MNEKQPLYVYGISSCDTVKKARAWLTTKAVHHQFIDFKKTPPTPTQVQLWLSQLPWDRVINRKGTTWRQLPADAQAAIRDNASALELALASPSVIKRPLVQWPNGQVTVGFDSQAWAERCGLAE